jgi:hypothetical protein
VPVLLAHHNLLPQATPRFAAYTELVNGGLVRSQLSDCSRPILYLHGHIHEDPIEVVERHCSGTGKLVLISAPLFVDGFNVVNVEFSDANRLLGVEVQRFRMRMGGHVDAEPKDTVRIPLVDPLADANQLLPTVMGAIRELKRVRFPKLLKEVQARQAGCAEADVIDAVVEAQWSELLEISDREEEPSRWTISEQL